MNNLVKAIIETTREGDAARWNDRIATVADAASVPMELIDWVGCPRDVAQRVFNYAMKNSSLDLLAEVVTG